MYPFPLSSQSDRGKWFPAYLTQKTQQKHANQGIQIFRFKNICETAQLVKAMHVWKAIKYPKDVIYINNVCHSIFRWWSCHRTMLNRGHWRQYLECWIFATLALKCWSYRFKCRLFKHWVPPGEKSPKMCHWAWNSWLS